MGSFDKLVLRLTFLSVNKLITLPASSKNVQKIAVKINKINIIKTYQILPLNQLLPPLTH